MSPISFLDWCSSNAEYLEQFGRNSGRISPVLDMGGGGWAAYRFDIVYDYTSDELAKIGWKEEKLTVSEKIIIGGRNMA